MESYDLALQSILLAIIILSLQLFAQGRVWINAADAKSTGKLVIILGIVLGVFGIGTILALSIFPQGHLWRSLGLLIALAIGLILAAITLRVCKWGNNQSANSVAPNSAAEPTAPAEPMSPDQQPAPTTIKITIPPSPDKTISITLTIT